MKRYFLLLLLVSFCLYVPAQNVGIGTTSPKASAKLDVSANDKGILIPRLTTAQRLAIANPDQGLLVFDSDKRSFLYFNGYKWMALGAVTEDFSSPQPVEMDGFAVDMDSNFAAIASPSIITTVAGRPIRGGVTLLKRSGDGWVKDTTLSNTNTTDSLPTNFYGFSVAISNNYLIVGAMGETVNNHASQGRAYIYRYNGVRWTLVYTCTEGSADANIHFGFSVDITDYNGTPIAVVGAPDGNRAIRYVKSGIGNLWIPTYITPPLNQPGVSLGGADQFGYAVSCYNNFTVVGAPDHFNPRHPLDVGGSNGASSGAAYLFVGSTYKQMINIYSALYATNNSLQFDYQNSRTLRFGAALSCNYFQGIVNGYVGVVVGAPGDYMIHRTSSYEFDAFLFIDDNISDTLKLSHTFSSITTQPNTGAGTPVSYFGYAVSLSENGIIITEPGYSYDHRCRCYNSYFPFSSTLNPGTAYVYGTRTNFRLLRTLHATTPQQSDGYGLQAAIDALGNYLLVSPLNGTTTLGQVTLPEF